MQPSPRRGFALDLDQRPEHVREEGREPGNREHEGAAEKQSLLEPPPSIPGLAGDEQTRHQEPCAGDGHRDRGGTRRQRGRRQQELQPDGDREDAAQRRARGVLDAYRGGSRDHPGEHDDAETAEDLDRARQDLRLLEARVQALRER